MDELKIYVACCKTDLYLLKSCIASIRYWNKKVSVSLLKDFSQGDFDTTELQTIFNVTVVETKYKRMGAYMKLQPFIETTREKIFLQDADMVWLGDIAPLLKDCDKDIAVHLYAPRDAEDELNKWYLNTNKLQQHYPGYKYPGFVFNTGSVFLNKRVFSLSDFTNIITWQEEAKPIHEGIFLCEDQGIIDYVVTEKYLANTISIADITLQLAAESSDAANYSLDKIKNKEEWKIIVHWFGKKIGLNSFYTAHHLLRFYEREYYSHLKYGYSKMLTHRIARTCNHFGSFAYELSKKIYYTLVPGKK